MPEPRDYARIARKVEAALTGDYLTNIHDPALREHAPPRTEVLVYHGTSSLNLRKIFADGAFRPSGDSVPSNYGDVTPGGVYVTITSGFFGAEMYAAKAAETGGGSPMVMSLVVPLRWLEPDPDDGEFDAEGRATNQYGAQQAFVPREIPVRRIRGVTIHDAGLAKSFGSRSGDVFDADWTPWMPIGSLFSKMKRMGEDLPEEYAELIGAAPRGLSRTQPGDDWEAQVAVDLTSYVETYMGNMDASPQDMLTMIYRKGSGGIWNAYALIRELHQQYGDGSWEEFVEELGPAYVPRPNESLGNFLRRVR